ncbi:IclR family transcriptional regulator domain-containing protein [Naasia aerilata]|uniref:IclR family transcriptional regulator n=1 Tax=Naasia aerilata TaxID=1162966 RepID=A0ABN6XPX5_9MICO|nr:IclR family transcriptional regulator C-terminal domain-containing protein [Naasia aerilata]BDZ46203.1 IclR family transcriptional regulator [Naasia aerilata]
MMQTTEPGTTEDLSEGMGGLAKGLAVIECFDREHPRLTVTEAARLAEIAPAAARRCMRTLEQMGYLSYDGKFYRPTPRFARLAFAYTLTDPLPVFAQPLLAELRDELNESSSLSVLDGDAVLFIARVEAEHLVATGLRVGGRLPAIRTAVGRVLLAGLPEEELSSLPADAIEAIALARRDGFSLSDQEYELGLRAIAVPVVDSSGGLVAAMSVSAVTARATTERMVEQFLPALRRRATQLGRML